MDKVTIPTLSPPPEPSSTVESMAYDKVLRKLFVKFHRTSGFIYSYDDFNDTHYKNLMKAKSFGTFVSKEVIPNHFCTKIPIQNAEQV